MRYIVCRVSSVAKHPMLSVVRGALSWQPGKQHVAAWAGTEPFVPQAELTRPV